MHKIMSNKKIIFLFMLPALIIFLSMVIFPIVMSGFYSTLQWDGIGKWYFTGLTNFLKMFRDGSFIKAVGNSIILALMSVFIQLPIAFLIALVLARGVKGEGVYRSIYFIPVIVSTVVIGQMWLMIYNPQYGVLNTLLKKTGLEFLTQEWLGNTDTVLMAVFIPLLWQYIGYHMLLLYAAIKSVPTEILEASRIDGANFLQETFHIVIPSVVSIIEVCVIMAILGSLKTFDLIFILTNGGPLHASEVPSTLMYNSIFQRMQYGYGSAISVFIVVECLLITVIIKSVFKKQDPLKEGV